MASAGEERMAWFRDAKYGIFIHWGLYAVLGGVWKDRRISCKRSGEWIMQEGKIPLREYRKVMESFRAEAFDARDIVKRVAAYGGRYLCFTAKHHDGFAMFDSKVSDYTVMHTPFGRDVVAELAQACAEYGIVFCLYYSQMQDWEDPDANGNTWDYDEKGKSFAAYFERKVKPQVTELLSNYGKIGMMWFDTPYDMPQDLSRELAKLVHRLQPDCLISGRIGYGLGDFREMNDNNIPRVAFDEPWESPMTLNENWGYTEWDQAWKSAKSVTRILVDVVSKGGNLLMNIGPDGQGRIPETGDQILKEVGRFLRENQESIYGTCTMPDMPYLNDWGECTLGKDRFYLHVLQYPEHPHEIKIYNLKTRVRKVWILETGEQLKFQQNYEIGRDEYRFWFYLPKLPPDRLDTVVVAETEGEVVFHDLHTIYRK